MVDNEMHWARDDADEEEIIVNLRANAKPDVSRFKGFIEMDARDLAITTLDPRHRRLLSVNIDSNLEADKTFAELLGKEPSCATGSSWTPRPGRWSRSWMCQSSLLKLLSWLSNADTKGRSPRQ